MKRLTLLVAVLAAPAVWAQSDLMPQAAEWRLNGNPADPDAVSLKKLKDSLTETQEAVAQAEEALDKIAEMPVEMSGLLIAIVPGPAVALTNPNQADLLKLLAGRGAYWEARWAEFRAQLEAVHRRLDPDNTALAADEFGEVMPESLPRRYLAYSEERKQRALEFDAQAAEINAILTKIEALSGEDLAALKLPTDLAPDAAGAAAASALFDGGVFEKLGDKVSEIGKAASAGDDSNAELGGEIPLAAKTQLALLCRDVGNRLALSGIQPTAGSSLLRFLLAGLIVQETKDAFDDQPHVQLTYQGLLLMAEDVLSDVAVDAAAVDAGSYEGQTIIDRKTALLRDKMLPRLRLTEALLIDVLIPAQQKAIDSVSPGGGRYKLFGGGQ